MKRVLILFVMIVMAVSNVIAQNLSFEQLVEKANNGDAKAQVEVGNASGMGKESLKWFKMAADQNYPLAYFKVGYCYWSGIGGVQRNKEEAVKWFRKAIEYNIADAYYYLAECYFKGEGVEQDLSEAEKYYKLAAAQGNTDAKNELYVLQLIGRAEDGDPKAQMELGDIYCESHTTIYHSDYNEAFKWYKMAADQGYVPAFSRVGHLYFSNRIGEKQNKEEGIKWIKKGADSNNADAQCLLGQCYENGNGVEKNAAEAIKYYKTSAAQGYAKAQYKVGMCYLFGQCVSRNTQQAVTWLKKAALQNYYDAYYHLGECYAWGVGTTQNYTEALKWYKKCENEVEDCEMGVQLIEGIQKQNGEAVNDVGNYWYYGEYRDPEKALKCYEIAAKWGYAEAESQLGDIYYSSTWKGIEKDTAKAISWFTKAAEHGDVYSQVKLGNCYIYSEGVDKNDAEAVKWYRRAAEQDDAYAQAMLSFCYGNGVGVEEPDMDESEKWRKKAVSHEDGVGEYTFGWLLEGQKYIEGAKIYYELAAKKGHKGAEKALAKLNGNSASTTASSKSSTSKQTTESNTNFTPNFTFKSTVPSDLNLQDDVVLENKTKYLIKNIAVYKKGVLMFSKHNVTPGSEKKVMYSNKDELSYYLGAELEFRLESTEAKQANDELYVEISQESHDMLITIKSSLGTKDKKMNSFWDKTKTFVKEKSEKASEKTKELINKVKK